MSESRPPTVGLIDYGMGNLRSVANAFRYLGADVRPVGPDGLAAAELLVLPGVGAFGDGMASLHRRAFVPALEREVLGNKKPFLGICLGMQLLATTGMEHGRNDGLGWIPGVVDKLPIPADDRDARLPHIGWNDVRFVRRDGVAAGLADESAFYFVHSYGLVPENPGVVVGVCRHGVEFPAVVQAGNIVGAQFHPEKSHKAGLALLRNFLGMGPAGG